MTDTRKPTTPRKPTSFRRYVAVEAMKRLLWPKFKLTDENVLRMRDAAWQIADAMVEGEKGTDGAT